MSDAERFEAFVLAYQDLVFSTAARLLGNRTEAEDVAQAVFLKAFERFAQIADSPSAGAWLKTVATNLCLNHLSRYRSRWRLFSELPRTDDDDRPFEATLASGEQTGAALERADEHARLEEAIARLPDHQRVPLVLFHFDERTYQEIAAALGVSLAKVKTDIHRGREALRVLLTDADDR
jgi:RNA polymerase sigma-70 factor (ECF subfamily)